MCKISETHLYEFMTMIVCELCVRHTHAQFCIVSCMRLQEHVRPKLVAKNNNNNDDVDVDDDLSRPEPQPTREDFLHPCACCSLVGQHIVAQL